MGLLDISPSDLGASSLLAVVIIMLLWGKLIPRTALKDKAEESERWRLAYEAEREARVLADSQTTELLEVTKTTQSLISAMFRNSEQIRQSGGRDVVSYEQG